MIGTKLGVYEVTSKLGEGGMGEVYRATDTRLRREVAIKVLPSAFTSDPERLARFEREAQLLAQLHHPNIASIFGIEESDGIRALVMELVEGPTLAERLEQGALPLDESLSFARQIAEALEEAHEKGIIHRDLKPQNVKTSREGKIKVLDFGLAKAMDPTGGATGSASQLAQSPTLTLGATVQGVILGTAAYMAPEQAAGGAADRRADVWAFGVVLYEMLVGRRLFEGETVSHVLAGVLKDEPDFALLPDDVPPRILRLLRRCLRKKPRERLQAIGDARLVIDEVLAGERDAEPVARGEIAPAPSRARTWGVPLAVALVALAAGGVATRFWIGVGAPPKVVRSSLLPPAGRTLFLNGLSPGPAVISHDGRHVAFVAQEPDGSRAIWVRDVDSLVPRKLEGTAGAAYPFWSPDGRWIGYFSGDLKKVPVGGGPPVTLAEARNAKGGGWSAKGTIVFAPDATGDLFAVSAAGGEAKQLTRLADVEGDQSHRHPRFLPDGEHFLFVARRAGKDPEIRIGSLDGTAPVPLVESVSNAEYASGSLLFVRGTTLMSQPFDPDRRTLSGEAVPLVEKIGLVASAELAIFSASSEGSLVFQAGEIGSQEQLIWRDRTGRPVGTLGERGSQFHPRISPSGHEVAVGMTGPEQSAPDIWVYDVDRGLRRRLTFTPEIEFGPVWSPDGTEIAFARSTATTSYEVDAVPVSGSRESRRIVASEGRGVSPGDWSPDGAQLVLGYWGGGGSGSPDLGRAPATGGQAEMLFDSEYSEGQGTVSPDGRWLAFSTNETGRDEVYVTSWPEPGVRYQVSERGGTYPVWRANGRELYFEDPSRQLCATAVEGSGRSFRVDSVDCLFELSVVGVGGRQWDVSADGERILTVETQTSGEAESITLVQHWDVDVPRP